MAWRKILTVGLVSAAAVVGCTVNTTNNNYGPGDGSTGGEGTTDAGKGGSSNGGGGSSNGGGGTANGGGGTSNGGGGTANGGGGSGATDSGTGDVCAADSQDGDCNKCVKQFCCQELRDCSGDADCIGSGTDQGEFSKFQTCIVGTVNDAGSLTSGNLSDCATGAAKNGIALNVNTQALVDCIRGPEDASTQRCSEKCFNTPLP